MERRRVLVAVGGGIAAYKAPELVRVLLRRGCLVRCALTPAGAAFVSPLVLESLTREPVRRELTDPGEERQIGHIELADWAELVLLAPATANRLAKLAGGIADDLVATLLLATRAPVLAAPAMNVNMWEHPATRANVERLRERGVEFVGPGSGELACGWQGAGRLEDTEAIAAEVDRLLAPQSLAGTRVLVSAGGTREALDPVRALTNRSSGKMGFAVAAEAARRGAQTVLVAAPTWLATPPGVRRIDVESALEMREAVRAEFAASDVAILAAAVADFRPARASARKIKKEALDPGQGLTLELVPNPDILAEVARERDHRIVVGFAAESHDLVEAARRKLLRKGCDLMVANDVTRSDAGFDVDANAVVFLAPDGDVEELPLLPKREVAARLLDRVEKLRGARG